jgi:hypothetical protein
LNRHADWTPDRSTAAATAGSRQDFDRKTKHRKKSGLDPGLSFADRLNILLCLHFPNSGLRRIGAAPQAGITVETNFAAR